MTKVKVAVLFNHVGEDEYEKLKQFDESKLSFEPEYDVAVATVQEEYDAIVSALVAEGYDAFAFNVQERLSRLHELVTEQEPDVVFNLVEHFHDDSTLESSVAAFLDLYEIPYTGAPPFALTLCRRKGTTKQLLLANDVPTPRYRLLRKPSVPKRHGLRYPMIVKPAQEDASAGVEQASVVDDFQQLEDRVALAFQSFGAPILVEEFIEGRELHVAILGNDPPRVLPLLEYDFSGLAEGRHRIISYAVKWDPLQEDYHRVHSICPAELPKRVLKRVQEVALRAYEVTNCRDYARLDVRLDDKGRPHVLEVNPNPDLTEGVSYMECAEAGGLDFPSTLASIVEMALERGYDEEDETSDEPDAAGQQEEVGQQEEIGRREEIGQREETGHREETGQQEENGGTAADEASDGADAMGHEGPPLQGGEPGGDGLPDPIALRDTVAVDDEGTVPDQAAPTDPGERMNPPAGDG